MTENRSQNQGAVETATSLLSPRTGTSVLRLCSRSFPVSVRRLMFTDTFPCRVTGSFLDDPRLAPDQ